MNQINHRKRLAARKQGVHAGAVSSFQAQDTIGKITPASPAAAALVTPAAPAEDVTVADDRDGDGFDLAGATARVQAKALRVLPAPSPTPQQIAQQLVNVDEYAYREHLMQLEQDAPLVYEAVVGELTRMNEQ